MLEGLVRGSEGGESEVETQPIEHVLPIVGRQAVRVGGCQVLLPQTVAPVLAAVEPAETNELSPERPGGLHLHGSDDSVRDGDQQQTRLAEVLDIALPLGPHELPDDLGPHQAPHFVVVGNEELVLDHAVVVARRVIDRLGGGHGELHLDADVAQVQVLVGNTLVERVLVVAVVVRSNRCAAISGDGHRFLQRKREGDLMSIG